MARTRPIRDSLRFGYAVGRVRVLETRLLGRSYYERLLDAKSFEDQRRVLSETVYGSYLEDARTAEDVELALDAAMADLYADFLETANLPEDMVAYFRVIHDFENLRGALKAEALGIPVDELLNPLGSVDADAFAQATPVGLRKAEAAARAEATGEGGRIDPGRIDAAVDVGLYREIAEIAERARNPYVRELARLSADLANLKTFVRVRAMGAAQSDLERSFVPGGSMPLPRVLAQFRVTLPEAVTKLISGAPGFGGADAEALSDPARFDVAADSLVARRMKAASMVAIGPEPVIAYVVNRKAETSMLRTLLIGKIAGVSVDALRTRMRDVA